MKKDSKYGWRRDLPDARDKLFRSPIVSAALPGKVDLRTVVPFPQPLDQGDLGSCTANAIANAHLFSQTKQKKQFLFNPSRLFVYYNERVMDRSVMIDAGASIRDGIKSIARQGVCSEALWPYIISQFTVRPDATCYVEALKNQAVSYARLVQVGSQLRGCLAAGYPFVFGFSVFQSFESSRVARTGIVNLPKRSENMLGGHAVLCCGYDNDTKKFLVQNSWGASWGERGYFYMPYEYLTSPNLAADFWTIRTVE